LARNLTTHQEHFSEQVPIEGVVTPRWKEKVYEQVNGETKINRVAPAYGFVMALYLDSLGRSHRADCFRQKRTVELPDNWAENGEGFRGRDVERKAGSFKDLTKR
jgi:hypothetical protein